MNSVIDYVHGREILDSRGRPTIEVEVATRGGSVGRASVPSGASTGSHEACELRDGDPSRFQGLGRKKALQNLSEVIAPQIIGLDVFEQQLIDDRLVELDGTKQKSRLGAGALLGVSLACSRAAAHQSSLPLYRYLGGQMGFVLPVPFVNILNGGRHADQALDLQEVMIAPVGARDFSEALRMSCEVFYVLGDLLKKDGHHTHVGDEGGYAPALGSLHEAWEYLDAAASQVGLKWGDELGLALDVAASELYKDGRYHLNSEKLQLTSEEMVAYLKDLVERYPVISIEDGLAEDDWQGFAHLMREVGSQVQVVGDDLVVTCSERLKKALASQALTTVLIKPNQVGTLSETLACIHAAQKEGLRVMISHRSGETEDPYIADLAVAVGAGQIKAGCVCRGERTAKYNQLLRIAEELGDYAVYGGPKA